MGERLPINQDEASDISENGKLQETDRVFPHDYRTVSELAPTVGYAPGHLRRLLEQDMVEGHKFGSGRGAFWVTTEQAVREYQMQGNNSESRVGRPRKRSP